MSLILLGDIAYPHESCVNIDSLRGFFHGKTAVANLEGPIVERNSKMKVYDSHKYNIYSSPDVLGILKKLNIKSVSLANNHFCDFKGGSISTIKALEAESIDYFGTQAKKWSVLKEGGYEYALYGTCTFTTGGNRVGECKLNFFNAGQALKDIKEFRRENPAKFIIVFMHWGYELADYPQPADRAWAREAIEVGANAVVGHHPHVVQGIEEDKEGITAYSLGNFILPQVHYLDKKLKYKTTKVLKELMLEVDCGAEKKYKAYFLNYQLKDSKLVAEQANIKKEISELTPFTNLSDTEYLKWFNKNRENSRYPTYVSYKKSIKVIQNNLYIKLLKTLRKVLIMAGFHNPFK